MIYPEDDKIENTPAEEPKKSSASSKEEKKSKAAKETREKKADESAKSSEKSAKKDSEKSGKKAEEKVSAGQKPGKADKEGKPSKPAKDDKPKTRPVTPRMLIAYREKIISQMMKRFQYKNQMMVPRLEKIVINVGIGEASQNPKLLESAANELGLITGQKAVMTRARKSISNFKLQKGMAIGCCVTLRSWKMWEFLDRLMNIAIPRIRDFRGLSDRSFDGRGNYSIGIREQIIFPEIDIDKIERVHGLDITFVTTAKTDEEAYSLLAEMGVPFRGRSMQDGEQAA